MHHLGVSGRSLWHNTVRRIMLTTGMESWCEYKDSLLICIFFLSLDGQEMKIGGLISVCSLLKSDHVPHPQDYTVTIKCTQKVVFSFSHKLCTI